MIELNRALPPSRRLAIACALTESVYDMSKAAFARAHPELSQREQDLLFIRIHYGRDIESRVRDYLGIVARRRAGVACFVASRSNRGLPPRG